mgnify:CR=1 FL=1
MEHRQITRPGMLWTFSEKCRWLFVTALLGSVLNTVFNTVTPQILRLTVDSVIGGAPFDLPAALLAPVQALTAGKPIGTLLLYAAAAVALSAALSGCCFYVYRVCTIRCAETFTKNMRDRLFYHIQRLPLSWHSVNQTGDIVQRCTSDVEVVRSFIAGQLTEVFRIVFLIAFALSVMFSMNVTLSLIALAFIPIVVTYSFIFFRKIGSRFRDADEAEGDLTADVQENLTGMRVVRAFGRERFEIEKFDKKNNYFADLWMRLGRVLSLFWGMGDFFSGVQVLCVITFGAVFAARGEISLGTFIAFISYNGMLVWPIRNLGRILSEMSKSGVSFARIGEILGAKEEDRGGTALPALSGDVQFSHVSFSYDGAAVLDDVSFTAKAGKTLAILGSTGSGKSTVVQLLTRLYELPAGCGEIPVDGVDVRTVPVEHLRSKIGLVNQEPFLFSRTIGENIAITRPDASMDEIRAAARTAHIDSEIMEFKDGYDTVVGERGVTLSGGQKQRVAIAGALAMEPEVLLMDEPTSALDPIATRKVEESIVELKEGLTIIIVTHSMQQAARISDRTAFFYMGRLVESDSTDVIFTRPSQKETEDYITGRFG